MHFPNEGVNVIPYLGITSYALETSPQVGRGQLSILSNSENVIAMYRELQVYMLHYHLYLFCGWEKYPA